MKGKIVEKVKRKRWIRMKREKENEGENISKYESGGKEEMSKMKENKKGNEEEGE